MLRLETQQPIKWLNVMVLTSFHLAAFIYLIMFAARTYFLTYLWSLLILWSSGFGITGGAHRCFTHRAFKTKTPLKIILLVCYSMAGQSNLHEWVMNHRVHHRCSDTDGDPHNAQRGFFFAHVGWLMQEKHPDVIRKQADIDMSDITDDPIISFHTRYFVYIKLWCCFIFPVAVPCLCWEEELLYSFGLLACVRYVLSLNFTWLVNSAAHIWGSKPYDKRLYSVENQSVAFLALGEGWHNYHHVFPWDYKAAELGDYKLNATTALIDFFAKIGWAYDLKTASTALVEKVSTAHGDGSHPQSDNDRYHPQEMPYPSEENNIKQE